MDAADLAGRLLEDAELRQHALSCPSHVVRHLGLDHEQLEETASHLEDSGGPGGDAARAALFALLTATAI
jgi:hypothetical protein